MKKSPVISLLSLPSIFLTCSLLYALPGNGAPGAPKGVLVPVSEVTQGGGSVYCGNINNEWIPGRMLKGNRFYSFAAERSDSLIKAKSAIGKAKKRLLAKAQRLQARLQERIPACAGVGLSQPTMPKWYPKPTVTPTPKVTPSPTATPTPGVTPTGTLRPTPTPGPTATASPEPTATPITSPTTTPAFQVTMTLQDFDGTMVPSNEGGDSYPSIYTGEGSAGAVGINTTDAVEGDCLQADVTAGGLSLQFNPDDGTGRGFASDYVADPAAWQFNTYNRMSFWIKRPVAASPLITDGSHGSYVGTYVKQIDDADYYSDETGGNHYYHSINLPNGGHWTQVILNWHPDHYRGETAGEDPGCVPYPTAIDGPNGGTDPESLYNYFDTLTRFYIDDTADPTTGTYLVDEIRFYQEPYPENDDQVYSLTGTYDPTTNEVVVTWNRPPDENDVNHEVRYAFSDIHELGWAAATPAPDGIVSPPGWQGYNGMYYDTTALPLAGQPVVYIAIKPENSDLFSQIAVRLDLP